MTKRKTDAEAIADFLSFFGGLPVITKTDMIAYFTDLSNSIPGEELFIEIVQKTWNVKEANFQKITKDNVRDFLRNFRNKLITLSKGADNDEYVLRRAFNIFDVHRTGFMGVDELNGILNRLEMPVDPKLLEVMFAQLDKEKNGLINFDKFANFVLCSSYSV